MKKFLIKIAVYGATVVIVSGGVIFGFSYKYWNARVPIIKAKLIKKSEASISIILGSSHSLYGFRSSLISSDCYNLSSISQSYYEDYNILKAAERQHKVKLVILPISYFSNFHVLERTPIGGEAERIFDYEKAYDLEYSKSFRYYKNKIINLSHIAKSIIEFRPDETKFDSRGNFQEVCDSTKYRIEEALPAFLRHDQARNFRDRHPLLDSIINHCYNRNISLLLVVMPATSEYLELVSKNAPEFEIYIQKLQAEKVKFSIIDCRKIFASNEALYFRDADHLSPCGRDSLSKYLIKFIPD